MKYREYQKQYYNRHGKLLKSYKHFWYLKNKQRISDIRKKYRKTNKDKIKKYLEIHQEQIKERNKKYRKTRIIKHHKQCREYYLIHKNEIFKRMKKYFKKRRKIDTNFKLRCYLRNRMYSALKGICKSKRTIDLLGCSIDFLKQHLELKFKPGMFWQNYGKWHIDHKRPCASFDLSKPEEQCKCFNYTNLQPLWAEENLSKNDGF